MMRGMAQRPSLPRLSLVVLAALACLRPAKNATAAPTNAGPQKLTIRACTDEPPILPSGLESALQATLLVRTRDGIGSAVLVSPDGFALTAAHVLTSDESVEVVSRDGTRASAEVVRLNEGRDVAMLKLSTIGATPCLSPEDAVAPIGSDIFVLGSPAGEELSFSVSKGIVSGHRELGEARFVQIDASVNPGNSGGPVLDAQGRIIGLASWKVSHVSMEGLSFAIPIDAAFEAIDLELGDATDPDWRERRGRMGTPAPTGGRDAGHAESPSPAVSQEELDRLLEVRKRARIRTSLIGTGAGIAAVGLVGVVTTGAIYYSKDHITPGGWKAAVGVNTTGWVLLGLGGAMFGSGFLVPKKPKEQKVAILPTFGGIAATGRF
jgi:S1-C subfamily serine protease